MGSIKKFILFITYDDQMIEYVLPGMNDRKYMLNLYNKTWKFLWKYGMENGISVLIL